MINLIYIYTYKLIIIIFLLIYFICISILLFYFQNFFFSFLISMITQNLISIQVLKNMSILYYMHIHINVHIYFLL